MLSTCPSCLTQVLHEDHLMQVKCECGTDFSPFMHTSHDPHDAHGNDLSQTAVFQTPRDFAESNQAFLDIRSFAENLPNEPLLQQTLNQPIDKKSEKPTVLVNTSAVDSHRLSENAPLGATSANNVGFPSECMVTHGDLIPGYDIINYFLPISHAATLNLGVTDPTQDLFLHIVEKAKTLKANAVVSIRTSFSPDGTKVLIIGTPVQCLKKNT